MRRALWIAAAGVLVLILSYCNLRPERRAAASTAGPADLGSATKASTMSNEPESPSNPSGIESGDIVIVPEADPMMVYDLASNRVIDRRNGDWFASQSADPEHGGIYFKIVSKNNELLYIFNTRWRLIERDSDRIISFKVNHAEKGRLNFPESLLFSEDLSLERFGRFLKSHPRSKWLQASGVIVIDNREKYREKYRSVK